MPERAIGETSNNTRRQKRLIKSGNIAFARQDTASSIA